MAMGTQNSGAITRSRKLKDVSEPVRLKTPAEMLSEKKQLPAELQGQHAAATKAEAADFQANGWNGYDRALKATRAGLALHMERVAREVGVLEAQVKSDNARDPSLLGEWESLQRQRALAVIAVRKCNRELQRLRKLGVSGELSMVYQPAGPTAYENMLLGCKDHVGTNGKIARGYLVEARNRGIISAGELA